MRKRIFSGTGLILAVCLLLSPVYAEPAVPGSQASALYTAREVAGYYESLNVFKHLKAFDVNNGIQDLVTREEFANLLISFAGLDAAAEAAAAKGLFADLAENDRAGRLEYAAETGLVRAFGKDKFGPEDYIQFEDAVKGILTALGYRRILEAENGPDVDTSLYLAQAAKVGLFRGMEQNIGYPIVYGKLLRMLENALTAGLVEARYSQKGTSYIISPESNLLNTVYEAEEREGVVTADHYTDIQNGGQGVSGGLKIDNVQYAWTEDMPDIIGQRVRYYVRGGNGDKELLYFSSIAEDGDILTLTDEDIADFQGQTYTYYDKNGRKKQQEIPAGCVIIYNGRVLGRGFGLAAGALRPQDGTVEFIENTQGGGFDVLKVESFRTVLVGAVDAEKGLLFDRLSGGSIALGERETLLAEDPSGAPADPEKIKVGSVVSAAESADGQMLRLVVSTETVSGTIEAISQRQDMLILTIDQTEYVCTYLEKEDWKVGKTGKFYLDKNGGIVYYEESRDVTMGYMIARKLTGALNSALSLRVLTSAGRVEVLTCADSLRVNDVKTGNGEKAMAALDAADSSGQGTVFTYRLNDQGQVTHLYTLYTGAEEDCPQQRLQLNNKMTGEYPYNAGASCFTDYKTFVDGATVVFCLPDDPAHASDDDFYVCTSSALTTYAHYASAAKPLMSYRLGSETLTASCITLNQSFMTRTWRLGIVCDMVRKVDEDNDYYTELGLFNYGSTDSFRLYDSQGINLEKLGAISTVASLDTYSLDVGDVVVYNFTERDGQRLLTSVSMLYDIETARYLHANPSSNDTGATSMIYSGDVYEKHGKYISVVMRDGDISMAEGRGTVRPIGDNFDRSSGNYIIDYIGSARICQYHSEGKTPTVSVNESDNVIVPYTMSKEGASRVLMFSGQGRGVFCYVVN